MANEKTILNQCLIALGKVRTIRVWRNNTGQAWAGKGIKLQAGQVIRAEEGDVLVKRGYPVRYGLPGSGDIIGIRAITITEAMVGGRIGQFCSFEVKSEKGKESDQQKKFRQMIISLGGTASVVRNLDHIDILARQEQ